MVAEYGAVVACGGFIEFDAIVLDAGGLELLGDSLFHIARGVADLELTRMSDVRY